MRCLHSIIAGRLSYQRHQRSSDPREVCDASWGTARHCVLPVFFVGIELRMASLDLREEMRTPIKASRTERKEDRGWRKVQASLPPSTKLDLQSARISCESCGCRDASPTCLNVVSDQYIRHHGFELHRSPEAARTEYPCQRQRSSSE